MEKWEYKIKELKTHHSFQDIAFEVTKEVEKERMFGGTKTKKITKRIIAEEIEISFNSIGQEGWELCGVAPLIMTSNIGPGSNTDRVFFIFKRRIELNSATTKEGYQTVQKSTYDVMLESTGKQKIQVIKILMDELSGLGLSEAKSFTDNTPVKLKSGISKSEAEHIKRKIELVGGLVEIQ